MEVLYRNNSCKHRADPPWTATEMQSTTCPGCKTIDFPLVIRIITQINGGCQVEGGDNP